MSEWYGRASQEILDECPEDTMEDVLGMDCPAIGEVVEIHGFRRMTIKEEYARRLTANAIEQIKENLWIDYGDSESDWESEYGGYLPELDNLADDIVKAIMSYKVWQCEHDGMVIRYRITGKETYELMEDEE